MDNLLSNALNAPSDFSEQFTQQIGLLKTKLATYLKAPVFHDTDMNYKASQELKICVDEKYQYVEWIKQTARYCLRLLLSSKGMYTTIKLRMAIGERSWVAVDWDQAPPELQVLRASLYTFLAQNQYERVPENVLEQTVPRQYTEIDNQPASIFNVLFAEED